MRMPLFVWAMETYAVLLLVALPALAGRRDAAPARPPRRHALLHPAQGGSIVLYQHMFWFFGHPEVYIMVLPAFGMISEILPVFSRKPIFGYKAIAFSTIAIAFFSMLVWAHHMFTTGLGTRPRQLLHDLVDDHRGPDRRQDLQLARDDLARQPHLRHADAVRARLHRAVHDRRPVGDLPRGVPRRLAAERHVLTSSRTSTTSLFGGIVFALFAGLYYWWPKMFGRMLDERLGKLHFWLMFVGFNLTFLPQHMLGLLGMPRRVYTYHHGGLWEVYNLISTIGSGVMTVVDPRLPRECLDRARAAEGRARRQRPVARGHARVVHDVAAAARTTSTASPT